MEYTVISLVFSLILAIVGGKIYKNKGYSFIAGFLWCGFFGLLGLLLVALSKPKVVNNPNGNFEINQENKIFDDTNPIH